MMQQRGGSVSDESRLTELGRFLAVRDMAVLSTGGSARALAEAGVRVTEVADHTGFPEIMDGRIKTLHPRLHGGIPTRRDDPRHREAMTRHLPLPRFARYLCRCSSRRHVAASNPINVDAKAFTQPRAIARCLIHV